jgi:hypothetical protein
MADSVVEIVNTTLTSTELPDSDTLYTLLTTDANTSYVIKDVQISSAIPSLNLQTYINDFNVGSWGETLTGSEVVDVSSTVKVKSSDFPVDLNHITYGAYTTSGSTPYKNGSFSVINGTLGLDKTNAYLLTSAGTESGASARNGFISSGEKIYQIYMDANSNQDIKYWTNENASPTDLTLIAYSPVWLATELDAIYYSGASGRLDKITLSTGVQSTVATGAIEATSTYMRAAYMNGYGFYIRSSSLPNTVYAVRLSDGIYFEFTGLQANTAHSTGTKLAVSYDEDSDKFYVYRTKDANPGPLYQDICPITKTTMDAATSNTTNSTAWTSATVADTEPTYELGEDEFGTTMTGHPTDGDKFYGAQYVPAVNTTFDIVYCSFSNETFTKVADGYTGTLGNQTTGPILDAYVPTAAQIEAYGYDGPPNEIDIRITGVKTTS